MQNSKKDFIQFGACMKNGIASCTTWVLMIVLAYNYLFHIQTVSTDGLAKLVVWLIGAVFLFNLLFSHLFIKKWSFQKRLTCFMAAISLYVSFGFYWLGFFAGRGTAARWLIFIGILFILYFICIAICQKHSEIQGKRYTQALRRYQAQRKKEHET